MDLEDLEVLGEEEEKYLGTFELFRKTGQFDYVTESTWGTLSQ